MRGYQGTREIMRAMTRVYDPADEHEHNPMAWPFHAKQEALQGLPPHIIINYEMDLIRDEGAVFARNLQAAGVPAIFAHHHRCTPCGGNRDAGPHAGVTG